MDKEERAGSTGLKNFVHVPSRLSQVSMKWTTIWKRRRKKIRPLMLKGGAIDILHMYCIGNSNTGRSSSKVGSLTTSFICNGSWVEGYGSNRTDESIFFVLMFALVQLRI